MKELTLERVKQAESEIEAMIRRTDLIRSDKLGCKSHVYLKTENLQLTGSFKIRGAAYKISQLSDQEKEAGIIACSAGNHAQGVALAASKYDLKCTICMPKGAPISKVEATKALGAEVILVEGSYDDAYIHAKMLQKKDHSTFVHPFDDLDIIAGQGTIALEILEQLETLEAVVVPIGGGGLISGVAYVMKTLNPKVKVYGVQAENASSMHDSLLLKKRVTTETVETFADGIAIKTPGEQTFSLVQSYVDQIVTVSEDEIATGILALMEKQKIVAEGAGATAVAALLFNKLPVENKQVVAIISGGNIDVNILSRVITRGLMTTGRKYTVKMALRDKPGQLAEISHLIQRCGANVIRVDYIDSDRNLPVTNCFLKIEIETRGFEQIKEIEMSLKEAGFLPMD